MINRCYLEITNTCNLRCDFCPKTSRPRRQLSLEEFDLLTDRVRGRVSILYFHLMGEPLLHPLLPDFIRMAREKGFQTVLTSNGTLLHRAQELLQALPHKIQLSLHAHEGNAMTSHEEYISRVMDFALKAVAEGTCVVLRLWNQGGQDNDNPMVEHLLEQHVPRPWTVRSDGYRMMPGLYLEYDRKFEWPEPQTSALEADEERFCHALDKQFGVLVDGSVVPCCLDHDGSVVLGNLFHESLDEVLSSPRARAMMEGFARHRAVEPLCQHCESAIINRSFRGK